MNFRCDGLELSDAINKVIKATSTKTTSPILEGIKIEASGDTLTLSATDLEISIKKSIKADVLEEGVVVVPGKFFSDYIRTLSDEQLTFSQNEKGQLKINYGESEGFIQLMDYREFPFINDVQTDKSFSIKSGDLKTLIAKTIFAVATDDARPILKGELFEINDNQICGVTLDGFRLAMVNKTIENSHGSYKVLVPARSLGEVNKLLPDNDEIIKVFVSDNYVKFDLIDSILTSRLIEGDFFNYKQIIHNNFTTSVTVNREQLLKVIDRACILSKVDRNNLVKFDIKENVLTITANSETANITENLNIGLTGEDLVIAFKSRYFSESLHASNDDSIKLSFNTAISPCIITPTDSEEYLYLILPVKLV